MRTCLILALTAVVGTSLAAQSVPRRPRLPSDADTNDAAAYYDLGVESFERNPDRSAQAFYWASRLDPASAPVWYARYAAEMVHNSSRLVHVILREARTMNTPEVYALDSLRLRAFAFDPFVRRNLEEYIVKLYANESIPRDQFALPTNRIADPEQVRRIEQYLAETDPYLRGLFAYSRGEMVDALRFIGQALGHENDWMRAERAGVFFELRRLDSARVEMDRAIQLARAGAGGDPRHIWESRPAYTVAMGGILEAQGNYPAAKAAYQDAYAASPQFYPAYLRLAVLGLRGGDTTTAIAALERELEILPNDYFGQVTLGATLSNLRRHDSALVHLRRATELEPWASGGWLLLARGLEAANDTAHAVGTYRKYLTLAPRNDAERLLAQRRIDQLTPNAPRQ